MPKGKKKTTMTAAEAFAAGMDGKEAIPESTAVVVAEPTVPNLPVEVPAQKGVDNMNEMEQIKERLDAQQKTIDEQTEKIDALNVQGVMDRPMGWLEFAGLHEIRHAAAAWKNKDIKHGLQALGGILGKVTVATTLGTGVVKGVRYGVKKLGQDNVIEADFEQAEPASFDEAEDLAANG